MAAERLGTVGKPLLCLDAVTLAYGAAVVVRDLSLSVDAGEVVTLIGANGAGKSTTLGAISGLIRPLHGRVLFAGTDLRNLTAPARVRLGIAHSREGRHLFPELTVRENLRLGAYTRPSSEWRNSVDECLTLFPAISSRLGQLAGTLSGGEQQMVAIMRALMARPRLLLLDEPSLGLSPRLTSEIFAAIPRLAEQGVGVLVVEQNATLAVRLAKRAYVLQTGRLVMEGTAADLGNSDVLAQAYLGLTPTVAEGATAPPPRGSDEKEG